MASDLIERLEDWATYEPMKLFCKEAIADILEAAAALDIERERAEKAEREIAEIKALSEQYMEDIGSAYAYVSIRDYAFAKSSLAEAKRLLKVFAEHMEGGMDLDDNGDELPSEQGVGWVYLTYGDFRAAARFLAQEEGHD